MAMGKDDYQHFVCIVAGDNPDSLIKEYDSNIKVEPYLVYKYKDARKIKEKYIEYYQEALKAIDDERIDVTYDGKKDEEYLNLQKMEVQDAIQDLAEMDDNEFFSNIVENDEDKGLFVDDKTGDIYSNKNKNGKYSYYALGKLFSIPFLLKDGREVYQAKKGDINWDKMHLNGGDIYERAWDMVMNNSKPQNEYEQQIFDNMQDKKSYFKKFETKENYVASNTAFWGYAFVSDMDGWLDADGKDQFTWMKTFYDMFIKNLPDDILLTIYECRK